MNQRPAPLAARRPPRPGRRSYARRLAGGVATVALVLVGTVVGSRPVDAAPNGTPDQSHTGAMNSWTTASVTYGQTFEAGLSGYITELDLRIQGSGGAVEVWFETVDAEGAPTGTVIGTGTLVADGPGLHQAAITPTAAITAGTTYIFFATPPPGTGLHVTVDGSYPGTFYIIDQAYSQYDLHFTTYVSAPGATITGTPPSDVVVDDPYTFQYSVVGYLDPPTTSLLDGDLPPGLVLGADGTIAGAPTAAGTYTFTVRAANGEGLADIESTIVVRDPLPPDAPIDAAATAGPGGGEATVSWTPPASAGDRPILDYTVTAAPGGATCTTAATTCTITDLTPGTPTTFTVEARSTAGAGPASAPSNEVVPFTTPGAPVVTATPGDGEVTLTWTAPDDGFSPLTGYVVEARTGADSFGEVATLGPDTTSHTVDGLTNGASYELRVAAVNAAGAGPFGDVVATTPFVFEPTVTSGGAPIAGSTLAPGAEVAIGGSELPAGSIVTVELHSTPVTLATATVGAEGVFAATVTIPTDTEPGAHELVLVLSEAGAPATASFPFSVVAAPDPGPAPSPAPGPTPGPSPAPPQGSGMPVTGAALAGVLTSGTVFVLLGAALVAPTRRRVR